MVNERDRAAELEADGAGLDLAAAARGGARPRYPPPAARQRGEEPALRRSSTRAAGRPCAGLALDVVVLGDTHDARLRKSEGLVRPQRRSGCGCGRLAFAGVGIITGATVYAFVSGLSEESAQERSVEIAVGRTVRVADEWSFNRGASEAVLEENRSEDFVGWAFDRKGDLITPQVVLGVDLETCGRRGTRCGRARGGRYVDEHGPARPTSRCP